MTISDGGAPIARLVPELDVLDLDASLRFYVGIAGFAIAFERAAERVAYLTIEEAEVMLQEVGAPGRGFRTAPLERPFGRGIIFETTVFDVDAIYLRAIEAGIAPIIAIEERWYDLPARIGPQSPSGARFSGNRQFVVADPDGYLWRFCTDLGSRAR